MTNTFENASESGPKTERRKLREKMGDIIFDVGQITHEQLGLNDIRSGEVQSMEFMGKVREILTNQALWDKVPEQGDAGFTLHGARHNKPYTREGLHQQLETLVTEHEQLGSAL